MTEIQKADLQARRRSLFIVLPGAVIGAVLLWLLVYFKPQLQGLFVDHADDLIQQPLLVGLGMLLLMSPVIALGGYCWYLGRQIVIARRFPPPGLAVSRDTPVLREAAAVRRGRTLQLTALLIILASLSLAVMMALLIELGFS